MNRNFVLTFALVFCLSFLVIGVGGHNPWYGIVAVYGSTPTIDGAVNVSEWSDAASVSFSNTEVFVKQDGVNLYIGFSNSETQFHDDDSVSIAIDVNHDGSLMLQPDDLGLGVYRDGMLIETNVTGVTWNLANVSGWTARVNSTFDMWQVEFNITYSKINVVAGMEKTIGVVFGCYRGLEGSSPNKFSWPPDIPSSPEGNPSMWGAITSTWNGYMDPFRILKQAVPVIVGGIVSILIGLYMMKSCKKGKRKRNLS
jgi:hypothetical protein